MVDFSILYDLYPQFQVSKPKETPQESATILSMHKAPMNGDWFVKKLRMVGFHFLLPNLYGCLLCGLFVLFHSLLGKINKTK